MPVIEVKESDFVRVRRRNWARLISKVWLESPALCSCCGKEMNVLAAISSPAQDDVIEEEPALGKGLEALRRSQEPIPTAPKPPRDGAQPP